jgi:hypothetical protein
MIFNVTITETHSKIIQIEAQTEEEAISKVERKYLDGEIMLDGEDFEDAHYMVLP